MELVFSHNNPINTVLKTTEGQVLYKIETPGTDVVLPGKLTTIRRVVLNETDRASKVDMQDTYCELAVIEWHLTESSKLRYNGKEVDISEFMPAEGSLGLVGRLVCFVIKYEHGDR